MVMLWALSTQSISGTAWTMSTAGLGFPIVQNRWYAFQYHIGWSGTGATSGLKVAAAATETVGTGGTQDRFITHQTVANEGTGGLATWLQGHWTDYAGSAGTNTLTIIAVNTTLVTIIEGSVKAGTGGTFAPQWGNRGTGGNILIRTGSWGWYADLGLNADTLS